MIKDLLQEAFALKNKGHYKHAIEVFYKVLEEDNTSIELLLEIGELFYKIGNEEKALTFIEQILNKSPSHIDTLKLLETIFINKNALEEAEQTAKNIYCFSNKLEDLAQVLHILNKENKFDQVLEYKIKNNDDCIKREQAIACYSLQKYQKSQEILETIQNKNNEDNILLAKVLYKLDLKNECATLIDQIDKKEHNNAELFNIQGLISRYKGNYTEAKLYLLNAIKLSPNNDEYYYNLANVFSNLKDLNLAKRYYNIAITLDPENRKYHFSLAKLYYYQKNYKRALEEIKEDYFEGRLLKAIILYESGYIALAQKEFNKLLTEDPNNEQIQEYLTRIKLNMGIS